MFESAFDYYIKRVNSQNFTAPLHSHTCFELVYYYRSGGFCIINGKKYSYKAGDFIVIEPMMPHDDHAKGETEIICIGFYYDNAEFSLKTGCYRDERGKIKRYLEHLTEEMSEKSMHYSFVANLIVKEILVEIERSIFPAKAEAVKHEHIKQVLNYIEQYYLTDIDLEQLSSISQYSYHHFRHIFKEEMGVSLKQYILSKRLTYAKKQLQETDISVTELAYATGFGSTSQFIKVFKEHFHASPLQYRKQYAENYINVENTPPPVNRRNFHISWRRKRRSRFGSSAFSYGWMQLNLDAIG